MKFTQMASSNTCLEGATTIFNTFFPFLLLYFFWTVFSMKKEEEESTPNYLYLHLNKNPTTPFFLTDVGL